MKNRICLCVACNYEDLPKEFVLSLFQMQYSFNKWRVEKGRDDEISLVLHGGYNLDEMRNSLIKMAITNEQTHVLFLDTDIKLPSDMIQTMIEDIEDNKDQGVEAITGIYVRKQPPYVPHVYPVYNKKLRMFHIAVKFPMNKLFQVAGAGCGMLMVKIEVFKRNKYPWFKFKYDGIKEKTKNGYIPRGVGEDLYFFLKSSPLTLCDPRLQGVHYGKKGYDMNTFIGYNSIKVKNGEFMVTKKQMRDINRQFGKK